MNFIPGGGIMAQMATSAAIATLPEPLGNLVKEMKEFNDETRELSDRLLDPIHGPLLPFCIKNTDRMFFCADITKDIILIAAGGAGFGTLAETLITQPSMIFQFMIEAVIPVIDEMAAEGQDMYKNNLDYAFTLLLGLTLDDLKLMTAKKFVKHIIGIMNKPEPDPSLMPQKQIKNQNGGNFNYNLDGLTVKQLKDMCRQRKLKCSGRKAILIERLKQVNIG